METELYCMLCGARLSRESGRLSCACCGADYSNMLLSESRSEDESSEVLELSISVDCVQIKPKLGKVPELGFADAEEIMA